jgi:hypothetical protein
VPSPKAKIPPSDATSQYPASDVVGTSDCTGAFSTVSPMEPRKTASPKAKIPPSDATMK